MKKNFAALAVCSAIVFCGMGAFASDGFEVVPAYSSINEERYVEEVYYPVLGDSSFPISKTINDLVEKDNVATRSSVMASVEETDFDSGGITGVFAFNSFYQYNVCGDIVSVKLNNYTYQGGAHGLEYITSYTGNIGGKDIFGVQDLFRDSENGQAVLKSFIKAEIAKNKDGYFSNATETIEESDLNSRFYIDEQGNIVVYFNPYEIDAYAGGIKEFQISPDMLSGRLKTEVYSYLTNKSGQRCDLRLNGLPYYTENRLLKSEDNDYLVPLREFAELLGFSVDWDKVNGAYVDGKPVSDSVSAVLVNDISYVPLTYFSSIKDRGFMVSEDYDGVINIFKIEQQQ